MSSTDFNSDVEALRAELRKKEHDLLLAARYGKSLLEENEQLKRDLDHARHQHASVNEVIQCMLACICNGYCPVRSPLVKQGVCSSSCEQHLWLHDRQTANVHRVYSCG